MAEDIGLSPLKFIKEFIKHSQKIAKLIKEKATTENDLFIGGIDSLGKSAESITLLKGPQTTEMKLDAQISAYKDFIKLADVPEEVKKKQPPPRA